MTFSTIINNFVAYLQQEKTGRTFETYKRKILVFQEYLLHNHDATDTNFDKILCGLSEDDLLSSVVYYVKTYHIGYKATADNYWAALHMFFSYISSEYNKHNPCFESRTLNEHLKASYNTLTTSSLELNTAETVLPPDALQYNDLVSLCNTKIDTPTTEEILAGRYNGVYTMYISSLIVKLTLLCGCKNNVIDDLQLSSYDHILHILNINQYCIHVPNKLALQLKRYIEEIRSKIVLNNPNTHFFVDITAVKPLDNAKKYAILKPILGHTKATSISKYAIIKMLTAKVSAHMIMEFTGYSNSVYDHCVELLEEETGSPESKEKSRIMDTALRSLPTFDTL